MAAADFRTSIFFYQDFRDWLVVELKNRTEGYEEVVDFGERKLNVTETLLQTEVDVFDAYLMYSDEYHRLDAAYHLAREVVDMSKVIAWHNVYQDYGIRLQSYLLGGILSPICMYFLTISLLISLCLYLALELTGLRSIEDAEEKAEALRDYKKLGMPLMGLSFVFLIFGITSFFWSLLDIARVIYPYWYVGRCIFMYAMMLSFVPSALAVFWICGLSWAAATSYPLPNWIVCWRCACCPSCCGDFFGCLKSCFVKCCSSDFPDDAAENRYSARGGTPTPRAAGAGDDIVLKTFDDTMPMTMQKFERELYEAGLDFCTMAGEEDKLVLDQALKDAGIRRPGDRQRIIREVGQGRVEYPNRFV